ncbi:hypothetical protein KIL84_020982 [Mauremys mutica]|uniref:Secreted protein n=1 Tax=Mauremys mutica TaxID=74926 RepID=A0A9D4AZJ2_9SAUR|nr:hypothetical protein KIL84_020982 [Mauremys mutica]
MGLSGMSQALCILLNTPVAAGRWDPSHHCSASRGGCMGTCVCVCACRGCMEVGAPRGAHAVRCFLCMQRTVRLDRAGIQLCQPFPYGAIAPVQTPLKSRKAPQWGWSGLR